MSSKYANDVCIRCSIKQIKCDNKEVCDNCDKTKNDCHRDRAVKKAIKKQRQLNKLYKIETFQALQTQPTEQGMLNLLNLLLDLSIQALRQQILQTQTIINEQKMSNPLLNYYFNNLGFNNNQVETLHQQILRAINEQRMTNLLLNYYPNELSFGNNNQAKTFHQQILQTVTTTSEQEMSNSSLNFMDSLIIYSIQKIFIYSNSNKIAGDYDGISTKLLFSHTNF
ncbi:7028_t:CDS:2 [Entrophospora sp. SA101]|nr:7028_t:CDS:2 [Entrophospora sp. SA101]